MIQIDSNGVLVGQICFEVDSSSSIDSVKSLNTQCNNCQGPDGNNIGC